MPESVLNEKNILVVDDEPDVLTLVKEEILSAAPKSTVETASTYEEAWEPPCLVDVRPRYPGRDGRPRLRSPQADGRACESGPHRNPHRPGLLAGGPQEIDRAGGEGVLAEGTARVARPVPRGRPCLRVRPCLEAPFEKGRGCLCAGMGPVLAEARFRLLGRIREEDLQAGVARIRTNSRDAGRLRNCRRGMSRARKQSLQ